MTRKYTDAQILGMSEMPWQYKDQLRAAARQHGIKFTSVTDMNTIVAALRNKLVVPKRSTKTSTTQLDRDIDDALADSFTVHQGQYRVIVAPDRHRGGYSAKLISVGIGTIMEPNGASARQALATLLRDLRRGDEYDRDLAREISAKGWSPGR